MRQQRWSVLERTSMSDTATTQWSVCPEESGCDARKAVHCSHRDCGPPRCWGQGGRTPARRDQGLFRRCQARGAQRHEEFSERAAATVMSACGPKQTWASALQMSAFGGKADMTICACLLLR